MTHWTIQENYDMLQHYSFEVGLNCYWNWKEYEGYRMSNRSIRNVNLFPYYYAPLVF